MIEKKDFKKISYFKGWVLENFPFIEADFDAITEYQLLCKIVEYLNKVIYNQKLLEDSNNELVDAFNNLKSYVDEYLLSIPDFKEAIELINAKLNELTLQVTNNTDNINLLNNKIDSEIEALDSNLKQLIEQNFNVLKNYVDNQIKFLDDKIDNLNITDLKVYDPTTGYLSPLQIVLNNIAQLSNKDGLTASEFDNLELTTQAFDNYQITAYEFDSSGKTILV